MKRNAWYQICLYYRQTPEVRRLPVARPTRSSYLRIARLPEDIGRALDVAEAPFRVCRFVAWGEDERAVGRRYADVLALREQLGAWPSDAQMQGVRAGEAA